MLATESAKAGEQRRALEAREAEAREAAARREGERQAADERFAVAQRQLQDAREAVEIIGRRAADARAAHAALVERATALLGEVARQEEALADLEARVAARQDEARVNQERRRQLRQAIEDGRLQLDIDGRELEAARAEVRQADEVLAGLHHAADGQEAAIREARREVDEVRTMLGELDVARATAESDLAHLAATCVEAVQASLDEVLAEVEQAERDGQPAPGVAMTEEPEDEAGDEEGEAQPAAAAIAVVEAAPLPPLMAAAEAAAKAAPATPEDAIAELKAKIDKLGPVNMMAIEQFDELEHRHSFLTVQRKDLRDSISATGEAIKRIDETSKERFREAFAIINQNFQETFAVLFNGGRAGLTLLDETDVLESGIEIVAQPPGQASPERPAALGRREGADGDRPDVRHLPLQAEPVLRPRRDRRPARRRQHRAVRRDPQADAAADPVHHHHAQPKDDGDRRPAVRRDDGGAGGVEADLREAELGRESCTTSPVADRQSPILT